MKFLMKAFTGLHVLLFRLSGGRLGGIMNGFKVLILNTTGRKSGKTRANPLGYFEHQDGYLIVASNGGKDRHPAWFYNLESNPQVTIEVMGTTNNARAQMVGSDKYQQTWDWMVAQAPQYANYAISTTRKIPLVLLTSVK